MVALFLVTLGFSVLQKIPIVINNTFTLARQALPLRGKWSTKTKCEENSNFYQLLVLRAEDNHSLKTWLTKKRGKYTSPKIQNEILQVYKKPTS